MLGLKKAAVLSGLVATCTMLTACAEADITGEDEVALGSSRAAMTVNGEKTQGHPVAAQLHGRRFLAWGGTDGQKRLNVLSSVPGGVWGNKLTLAESTNGEGGVALTVFRDQLFLAWTGTDNRVNLLSSADGVNWGDKRTFDAARSYDAPALAVHEGRLYVAFTGTDDHLNTFSSADGRTFGAPATIDERSYDAPSLTSFKGHLILGWTGIHNYMNIAELDAAGRKLRDANCDETSADGTFMMAFGDTLIVSWRGNSNEWVNYAPLSLAFLDGWLDSGSAGRLPNKVTTGEKSNRMPTFADLNGSAALLWRGTDAQVNILEHVYERTPDCEESFSTSDRTFCLDPVLGKDGALAAQTVVYDDQAGEWVTPGECGWSLTRAQVPTVHAPLVLDAAELLGIYVQRCGDGVWAPLAQTPYQPVSQSFSTENGYWDWTRPDLDQDVRDGLVDATYACGGSEQTFSTCDGGVRSVRSFGTVSIRYVVRHAAQ